MTGAPCNAGCEAEVVECLYIRATQKIVWLYFLRCPMDKPKLTQERLRQLFQYDPETGLFTRLTSANNRVRTGDIAGSKRADGYIKIRVDFDMYYAHRLAWLYMNGEWPTKKIDHINGNKSDNRWANLRDVSASINAQNCLQLTGSSGEHGVHCVRGRWKAEIKAKGKCIRLGSYSEKWRAAAAYLTAKVLCHPDAAICDGLGVDLSCFSKTAIKNLAAAGYL